MTYDLWDDRFHCSWEPRVATRKGRHGGLKERLVGHTARRNQRTDEKQNQAIKS